MDYINKPSLSDLLSKVSKVHKFLPVFKKTENLILSHDIDINEMKLAIDKDMVRYRNLDYSIKHLIEKHLQEADTKYDQIAGVPTRSGGSSLDVRALQEILISYVTNDQFSTLKNKVTQICEGQESNQSAAMELVSKQFANIREIISM